MYKILLVIFLLYSNIALSEIDINIVKFDWQNWQYLDENQDIINYVISKCGENETVTIVKSKTNFDENIILVMWECYTNE